MHIYNLQPDLLGSFPADRCPDITSQFGCGLREKFRPSVGGGGLVGKYVWSKGKNHPFGRGGGKGKRGMWQITHSNLLFYTSHPLRHPILSFSQQHFPCKDISFRPHLPASKNLPEGQIHWISLKYGVTVQHHRTEWSLIRPVILWTIKQNQTTEWQQSNLYNHLTSIIID